MVDDDVAAIAEVEEGVLEHRGWFGGRMVLEATAGVGVEGRAPATAFSEFYVVDVRSRSLLEQREAFIRSMPTLFFDHRTLSGLRLNCFGSTERFAEAPPTRLRNLLADSSEAGRFARHGFHACRRFARHHIGVQIGGIHLVASLR
jgi:hypothetical protein